MKTRRSHVSVGIPFVGLFMFAAVALGSDQVVSDAGDNGGAKQLRASLVAAQSSGGGTITFSTGVGTITLEMANGPLPAITKNITIDGGNAITISGGNSSVILTVSAGGTLTLINITVIKGFNINGS